MIGITPSHAYYVMTGRTMTLKEGAVRCGVGNRVKRREVEGQVFDVHMVGGWTRLPIFRQQQYE